MKAFIFDPLWNQLITEELEEKLSTAEIETMVVSDVAPITDCKELFSDEEKVICINPDYVGWKVSADDYKDIPNLKAILGAATSFSWIDMTHATENNIPVCNIKNFSSNAVAEWATMMMLNVARQTPRLIKDGFPLDFDADFMKYRGIELHGKTAGILGLGNIGSAIAKRCAGLGMNVVHWSKNSRSDECEYMDLDELMKSADVIFPTMALNDDTKTIITDEHIKSMKSSAILVTIAHELFDEELVLDMVKQGKLFGFGLEAKPGTFNNYEGNVWAAPEYGWTTDGSMNNSMVKWVDNIVAASSNEFPNQVNS